jgi:hypothetical protein
MSDLSPQCAAKRTFERTEPKSIHEVWRDNYVAMVADGVDPIRGGRQHAELRRLLLAQHGGTAAARLALMAGLDFMARREQVTPEPPGGLH